MTCPVLLFKIVCYSPLFEAFFEKVPFLNPHQFRLIKTFCDDAYFGGSDEPPYCALVRIELSIKASNKEEMRLSQQFESYYWNHVKTPDTDK